jgi:hypothetical protein
MTSNGGSRFKRITDPRARDRLHPDCRMTKESPMKPAKPRILTINGGSSSIKLGLCQVGEPLKERLYGKVDRIGLSDTNLTFSDPTGNQQDSHIGWSAACNAPRPSWSPMSCWMSCIASARTPRNISPARLS